MKQETILLHRNVFMPQHMRDIIPYNDMYDCLLTNHAEQSLDNRNISKHDLWKALSLVRKKKIVPFEIEIDCATKRIIKAVWRVGYVLSNHKDISFVIQFNEKEKPLIKTVWVNDANDRHFTLDSNNYASIEQYNQVMDITVWECKLVNKGEK